jgi:FkbM family methyltransferase
MTRRSLLSRLVDNRVTRPAFNPAMRLLAGSAATRGLINWLHNRLSYAQRERFFWSFASAYRGADTSRFRKATWVADFGGTQIPVALKPDRLWERWGIALGLLGHDAPVKETYANIVGSGLKPDRFVDIGANNGTHSLLLAAAGVSVTAFEPNPVCGGIARELFEDAGVVVDWRGEALGREPGSFTLAYPDGDTSLGHVVPLGADVAEGLTKTEVDQRRLDDCEFAGERVLVKIDVEGCELDVLEGARRFICERRPLVVFESNAGDLSRVRLHAFFDEADYDVFDLPWGAPQSGKALAAEAFAGSQKGNFLAAPRGGPRAAS